MYIYSNTKQTSVMCNINKETSPSQCAQYMACTLWRRKCLWNLVDWFSHWLLSGVIWQSIVISSIIIIIILSIIIAMCQGTHLQAVARHGRVMISIWQEKKVSLAERLTHQICESTFFQKMATTRCKEHYRLLLHCIPLHFWDDRRSWLLTNKFNICFFYILYS